MLDDPIHDSNTGEFLGHYADSDFDGEILLMDKQTYMNITNGEDIVISPELAEKYEVIKLPELEADDAMGIYATAHEGNIICSPDKDMRQIPGKLFDMKELTTIDPIEGAKWHLIQTLAGDQTDGYAGVPGIGIKRAVALFEEDGYTWQTVVKAFEAKDLTEDDALMNARLARILTCTDYDPIQHSVIPWTPTADYRVDDGAVIQAEKA